jgi:hypothetical protein
MTFLVFIYEVSFSLKFEKCLTGECKDNIRDIYLSQWDISAENILRHSLFTAQLHKLEEPVVSRFILTAS